MSDHTHALHGRDAGGTTSLNRTAFLATLHCLSGCAVGEVLGLMIGTALGWGNASTIALAIVLAFLFGYSFTMVPLLRSGLGLAVALPLAFASDSLSIAVMEIADNGVMLAVPGAMDAMLTNPLFWGALAFALAVAFVVAFPLNRVLIARGQGHAVVHAYHGGHDGPDAHGEHGGHGGRDEHGHDAAEIRRPGGGYVVLGLAAMAVTIAVAVGGVLFVESREDDDADPVEHGLPAPAAPAGVTS